MKTLALTLVALLAGLSMADSAQAQKKTRAQLLAEQAQRREANSQQRIAELVARSQAVNNPAAAVHGNTSQFSGGQHGMHASTSKLNSRQREQLRQLQARRRAQAYRQGYLNGRLGNGFFGGGLSYYGPSYILPPQQYVFVPGRGFVPLNVNYGWGY